MRPATWIARSSTPLNKIATLAPQFTSKAFYAAIMISRRIDASRLTNLNSYGVSAFLVGMHPQGRRNLACFGQHDHVHARLVGRRSTGPAPERSFQLPDRSSARPADGIKRNAGAGLTAIAFNFHPAVSAIQALGDAGRWLRRSTEGFHADRPCFCFSPESATIDDLA